MPFIGRRFRGQQGQRPFHSGHLPHGAMPMSGNACQCIRGSERLKIAAVEHRTLG